jgi:hypothetical protein
MDSFEALVAGLLEGKGYWVRSSFKVALTKKEKVDIGRHSTPRWELDLIAYKASDNELLVVECKSFLDSRGVSRRGFDGSDTKRMARYKLFNDEVLRRVVFKRLVHQLVKSGAIPKTRKMPKLCLAAAKICSELDREWLREHFGREGWILWDDMQLHAWLQELAVGGYANQIAAVVAKLLLRKLPIPK